MYTTVIAHLRDAHDAEAGLYLLGHQRLCGSHEHNLALKDKKNALLRYLYKAVKKMD
jgi:hypothetical protein